MTSRAFSLRQTVFFIAGGAAPVWCPPHALPENTMQQFFISDGGSLIISSPAVVSRNIRASIEEGNNTFLLEEMIEASLQSQIGPIVMDSQG